LRRCWRDFDDLHLTRFSGPANAMTRVSLSSDHSVDVVRIGFTSYHKKEKSIKK